MFTMRTMMGVAVMMALGIGGCSSEAKKPVATRTNAVDSMEQMQVDLARADGHVQATQATLHALAEQEQGDLRPSFDRFAANVKRTSDMQGTIDSRATDVTNRSSAYVHNWTVSAQDIRDPAMRDSSLKRQSESREQQRKLIDDVNGIRASYANYVQTIRDAQAFAASDLTPGGMAKLREHTAKSDEAAKTLRDRIASVNRQLGATADNWRTMPIPAEPQPKTAELPSEP